MAQKVSDILKKQDATTVRGVEQILVALQARYPQNLELKSAIRDMQDLAKQLEADVDAGAERVAARLVADGRAEDVQL